MWLRFRLIYFNCLPIASRLSLLDGRRFLATFKYSFLAFFGDVLGFFIPFVLTLLYRVSRIFSVCRLA